MEQNDLKKILTVQMTFLLAFSKVSEGQKQENTYIK